MAWGARRGGVWNGGDRIEVARQAWMGGNRAGHEWHGVESPGLERRGRRGLEGRGLDPFSNEWNEMARSGMALPAQPNR
jgi:hypothetical protein